MHYLEIRLQDGTKAFRQVANGATARLCDPYGFTIPDQSFEPVGLTPLTEQQFMQLVAELPPVELPPAVE